MLTALVGANLVRMLRQPHVPELNLAMPICAHSLCRKLLGICGVQLIDLMHDDGVDEVAFAILPSLPEAKNSWGKVKQN